MTTRWPIICMACTRLHGDLETCDAYPAGVPAPVLDGGDHRQRRGDERGGLVFDNARTPGATVAFAAWEAAKR